MPFLLAVAAYLFRLVRRPIDRRLKLRRIGPLVIMVAITVLAALWGALTPPGVPAPGKWGELAGILSVALMTVSTLLATRIRALEPWFGGLDQMYRWHRYTAFVAVALLVPHVLITPAGAIAKDTAATLSELTGTATGRISTLGLAVLVLVSLPRVGQILRLPYYRWLFLHRLIGFFLLLALLHGLLLSQVITGSRTLSIVYLVIAAVGTLAYLYTELVMRRRAPSVGYTVSSVHRRPHGILDITLAPNTTPHPMREGQFVFLKVTGRSWHEHPFSLSGAGDDGSVRLSVRALGRETHRMAEELTPGTSTTISGPYGRFDHTVGGPHQLWVAGGIGVAPFLSWVSAMRPDGDQHIDLFYSISSQSHASYLEELTAAADRLPQLNLHVVDSSTQGRLTIENLQPYLGDRDHPVHAFLCGPRRMVRDLTKSLRASGLTGDHVHSEDSAFR